MPTLFMICGRVLLVDVYCNGELIMKSKTKLGSCNDLAFFPGSQRGRETEPGTHCNGELIMKSKTKLGSCMQ